MRGAIPPLFQYAFMAWCLVKHRDSCNLLKTENFLLSDKGNALSSQKSISVLGLGEGI
jgi:hypothetical protein